MSKTLVNFRIDKIKYDRLKEYATNRNTTCTAVIECKIDEILSNGYDEEMIVWAQRQVNDLRLPFVYVRTEQGRKHAKEERNLRVWM